MRAAIVTGASQGIGRRVAVRLAEAGLAVALAARSEAGLEQTQGAIEGAGGTALVIPTDLRDDAQVGSLADEAETRLGPVYVVVNATGIAGPTAPLWEIGDAAWCETVDVNLVGAFRLCRAVLPAMIGRRSGSIVIIGSATGKRPMPGRTPYAASKAGLVGLVRSLAWDTGPYGVRVNLVSPGPVTGERLDAVVTRQGDARGLDADAVRAELIAGAPLGRLTTPDDVAAAVLFLSGDASRGITGEDVNVSTGWVMH